jgi:hypothetical protein
LLLDCSGTKKDIFVLLTICRFVDMTVWRLCGVVSFARDMICSAY